MSCPWQVAYELHKETYTKDEIDDMLLCEINELIYDYEQK